MHLNFTIKSSFFNEIETDCIWLGQPQGVRIHQTTTLNTQGTALWNHIQFAAFCCLNLFATEDFSANISTDLYSGINAIIANQTSHY